MDFARLSLSPLLAAAGWLLAAAGIALALRAVRWREASAAPLAQVLPAALFALVALGAIRAPIGPALDLHLSGMAALALAVGTPLALAGGAVVVAARFALGDASWSAAGWTWIVAAALPVAAIGGVLALARRALPPNPFVYVFVVAFLGAACASAASTAAAWALARVVAGAAAVPPSGDALVAALTLAFGEATLTGMLVTLGVVYRPRWIATWREPVGEP